MKLYIDATKATELGLDKLFTNGIMNSVAEALANQREQQANPNIALLNYNQTHGIVGDLIEVGQEKLAVTTNFIQLATGGARQTGEIKTQLTELTHGNLNTAAHSAGTVQDYLGTKLNQEAISKVIQNNPDAKFTTQYSGSPVSSNAAEELFSEIYGGVSGIESHFGKDNDKIENIFKSSVNPGDLVAILGGNTAGVNNKNYFWANAGEAITHGAWTLFSGKDGKGIIFDGIDPSPHSGYKCVIGCGEGGITPAFTEYYNPLIDGNEELQNFYSQIHTKPELSNVYNQSAVQKEIK